MSKQGDGFRMMRVVGVERIAPHMQRLRLAGDDLVHFDTLGNLHVRLHVEARHKAEAGTPVEGAGDGPRRKGASSNVVTRYYTIRRIDAATGWLDIDFVLHAHAGPACNFALQAKPGDICGISGPCGLGVKKASRYLLAGDETALPAIARIAETLPPDVRGDIVIETCGPEDRLPFAAPAGMTIRWVDRWPRDRGPGRGFIESVREKIEVCAGSKDYFIWLAGEFGAYEAFRPRLAAIPKPRYINVCYWRR
ncbi:siderophore-interacting protein [Labrys neptuniae]|uniref:Siderophore-interacting protein n=1 Tax=Labrys neptuniae TaxID=376174 RepID=A0ABV3PP03_9HYPH